MSRWPLLTRRRYMREVADLGRSYRWQIERAGREKAETERDVKTLLGRSNTK